MKKGLGVLSEKKVADILLKLFLFILSVFFMYVGIASIGKPQIVGILLCIGIGITFNPIFIDKIIGKKIKNIEQYYDILRTVIPYIFFVVVLCLAMIVCVLCGIDYNGDELGEFISVLNICIYILYILIMFICKDENKRSRYFKYGLFYAFCISLLFATGKVETTIIEIFNYVFNVQMDNVTYGLLNDGCLLPLKEAMLTYIILDTAIEIKRGGNG